MKPVFQKLTNSPDEGFVWKEVRGRHCDCPWHCHEEYELILVLEGAGYRMIGDDVSPRRPCDLVLVGANLPHIYHADQRAQAKATASHTLLIQFVEDCLGGMLLRLPALGPVRRLLERASRGLHFTGATSQRVARMMQEMRRRDGLRRVILFLGILETLAGAAECRALASPGFVTEQNPFDQARMNQVCQFIHERLGEPLTLAQLARLAHLSEGAFSRFFRAHAGKTFPEFVNELRVGRACRLLAETESSITEIAFACGFANLSNFNRQFLRLKRMTPRAFRRAAQRCTLPGIPPPAAGLRSPAGVAVASLARRSQKYRK